MKLYEIEAAIESCALFDPETGEYTELDAAALDALNIEREQKLENIACWIKSLSAEADAVKTEKMKLAARQQRLELQVENLKSFLMDHLDGEKLKSGRVSVSYRTTKNIVDIKDESVLPPDMLVATYKPDKTAIKNALLEGELFEGVSLIEKKSIIIK